MKSITYRYRPCRLIVLMVGAFLVAYPADAAVTYSTSFNGTLGSMPTGWEKLGGSGNWELTGPGKLVVSQNSGSAHYTGATFADGVVEASFRKAGFTGVATRVQGADDFYHARLNGGNLELYCFREKAATKLASVAAPGNDVDETWRIRMATFGSTITASLYDENDQFVAATATTDTSFAYGTVGVRGDTGSVWEDFAATDHFAMITTADGNGADAYIECLISQSGNCYSVDDNFGDREYLAVKNGGSILSEGVSRKTYLRFDVGSLSEPHVQSAILRLQQTGTSGTDGLFEVYGLDDDLHADNWGENSITWSNAPGNDKTTLGGVLDASTVLLGEFNGVAADNTLMFTSAALVEFVQADSDGLVTFVITRKNNMAFDAAPHAFHSKEGANDLAWAPTLELVTTAPEPSTLLLLLAAVTTVIAHGVRRRRRS